MPDGPYATPDEERLLRMMRQAGSPEAAGQSLIERLEALEAAVAAYEDSLRAQESASEESAEEPTAAKAPEA